MYTSHDNNEPRVWTMKRNCSISPRHFILVYCSFIVLSMVMIVPMAIMGFWAIIPFVVANLSFVGAAFLVYARHATDYERVEISAKVSPKHLCIEVANGSDLQRMELDPYWIRVGLQNRARPRIEIRTFGETILVGTHLPVHRRAIIALEMRQFLSGLEHRR